MTMQSNIDSSVRTSARSAPSGGIGVLHGVGWRLEQHDRGRIELKLRYDRPAAGRKARYRLNLYFFIPPNLGIGRRRYDKDDFFEDLQTYTRYVAPALALGSLADFRKPHHPLESVLRWIANPEPANAPPAPAKLTHALKLYAAALAEALDEERNFLRTQAAGRQPTNVPKLSRPQITERSDRLVDALDHNLSAFRQMRAELIGPRMDPAVGAALAAVDEYISLEAEETLFKILAILQTGPQTNDAVADRAARLIRSETDYRASLGLPSRVSPDADDRANEAYQYRHGVLKKFIASALFLNLQRSRFAKRATEIIAAVAAGLAMTFAVGVAVLSIRYAQWSIYSTQWIVAAVVAYIFKDRIKEWLRTLGSRQLSRWLADRRGILRDQSLGRRIGTVSETHRYVEPDRLERAVRDIRLSDPLAHLELERGEERIMCYTREIELNGDDAPQQALTDILRYDFDRYTGRMDDPLAPVSVLAEDGVPREVMTPRVYRVGLVLHIADLSRTSPSSTLAFIRVVLTRRGIRRLEFAR